MRHLVVSAAHSVKAFIVGSFVWCVGSLLLSPLSPILLGRLSVPGYSFTGTVVFGALAFFPLFFLLRLVRFLNWSSLVAGLVIETLTLVSLGYTSTTAKLLFVLLAVATGSAAFLTLRSAARYDQSQMSTPSRPSA